MTKIHPSSAFGPDAIAIVGMACRFPGADDVEAYWDLLLSGKSMVRTAPERIDLKGHPRSDPKTQFWGNFLDDVDAFDHRFFHKSSREAASWDPQKRLLLEVVYQALESSGYFGCGKEKDNDYGCFIGAAATDYYDNVAGHPANGYSLIGTSRAFYSGRVSHQFGLTGPAMTIDTACSSSLVALHAACQAIRAGECSRAIAGSTNLFTSPYYFQSLAAAGFLSETGQCKPFDAMADGYCRGEGVAAVVLKPLATAIAEGDHVLGVILGTAIGQNTNEAHITVPCATSQADLYSRLLSKAQVSHHEVTYVESHGTGAYMNLQSPFRDLGTTFWGVDHKLTSIIKGTQVGDPIECASLQKIFGSKDRAQTLHFGSVKSQIGHLEASAGLAGLIKVLLMLQHETIVSQAGFRSLNPNIRLSDGLAIPRTSQLWHSSPHPRTACVSGYGAAGSNAAVVLRQSLDQNDHDAEAGTSVERIWPQPLFLAAASQQSLMAFAARLLERLPAEQSSDDARRTSSGMLFALASKQNHALKYMYAKSIDSPESLRTTLQNLVRGDERLRENPAPSNRPIILVFGGQERPAIGLPKQAYERISLLRQHLHECDAYFQQLTSRSIFPAVFQSDSISHLPTLHAALFSVQWATAKCWVECGLDKAAAVVGHSFGQFAALCIAGCLSVPDAMRLVVARAELIEKSWGPEKGAMLSIRTDLDTVLQMLADIRRPTLELACRNHPTNHVVVGSYKDMEALEEYISCHPELANTVRMKRLDVTHGFHSIFTEPILSELDEVAKTLAWHEPSIHVELCHDESGERVGPHIVAEHTRRPVFFANAIERLSERLGGTVWLEAGMRTSALSLVRSNLLSKVKEQMFCSSPLETSDEEPGLRLSDLTVALWNEGLKLQHWAYHCCQKGSYQPLHLPPYQFEKSKHWLPFQRIQQAFDPKKAVSPTFDFSTGADDISFFSGPLSNTENTSVFTTSPRSRRFKALVEHHIVFGQALAPLALYLELPSRAVLTLMPSITYREHVCRVESLEIFRPIGLDVNRIIFTTMTVLPEEEGAWSYSVSSRERLNSRVSVTHAVGKVRLQRRNDIELAETVGQMGDRTTCERCRSILASETASKLQGAQVYRAAYFDYCEAVYHGVKAISGIEGETVGRVVAKADPDITPSNSLYDAAVLDSILQNAAMLVDVFHRPSKEYLFVCVGIERIITGGAFDIHAGEWLVHSVVTLDAEDQVHCDCYVYDERTQTVVLGVLGFHYKRTPVDTWQRSMSKANRIRNAESEVQSEAAQRRSLTEARPVEPSDNENKSPSKMELYRLLQEVTDIPIESMVDNMGLEELGVDSLMATEVMREVNSKFAITLRVEELLAGDDLAALAAKIGISEQ